MVGGNGATTGTGKNTPQTNLKYTNGAANGGLKWLYLLTTAAGLVLT